MTRTTTTTTTKSTTTTARSTRTRSHAWNPRCFLGLAPVFLPILLLLLQQTRPCHADKDDSYYMAGGGNPLIQEKMYWKDADNILQDLSQFKALYVKFHWCSWTWMQTEEADNDVEENDYWYMGKIPPMGANVAFSLYGVLKSAPSSSSSSSTNMCHGGTFINSFYTNRGFPDFARAMYLSGQKTYFSSGYTADDDGTYGKAGTAYSAECAGYYGVGCDATYGFAIHSYSTKVCNPANATGVKDTLQKLNNGMQASTCVQVYNAYKASSYSSNNNNNNHNNNKNNNNNNGDDDGYGVLGTPLELLYYSSACFYQNYYAPNGNCPDPYGIIAGYQATFATGLQLQKKELPYEIYHMGMRKGQIMVGLGAALLVVAMSLFAYERHMSRKSLSTLYKTSSNHPNKKNQKRQKRNLQNPEDADGLLRDKAGTVLSYTYPLPTSDGPPETNITTTTAMSMPTALPSPAAATMTASQPRSTPVVPTTQIQQSYLTQPTTTTVPPPPQPPQPVATLTTPAPAPQMAPPAPPGPAFLSAPRTTDNASTTSSYFSGFSRAVRRQYHHRMAVFEYNVGVLQENVMAIVPGASFAAPTMDEDDTYMMDHYSPSHNNHYMNNNFNTNNNTYRQPDLVNPHTGAVELTQATASHAAAATPAAQPGITGVPEPAYGGPLSSNLTEGEMSQLTEVSGLQLPSTHNSVPLMTPAPTNPPTETTAHHPQPSTTSTASPQMGSLLAALAKSTSQESSKSTDIDHTLGGIAEEETTNQEELNKSTDVGGKPEGVAEKEEAGQESNKPKSGEITENEAANQELTDESKNLTLVEIAEKEAADQESNTPTDESVAEKEAANQELNKPTDESNMPILDEVAEKEAADQESNKTSDVNLALGEIAEEGTTSQELNESADADCPSAEIAQKEATNQESNSPTDVDCTLGGIVETEATSQELNKSTHVEYASGEIAEVATSQESNGQTDVDCTLEEAVEKEVTGQDWSQSTGVECSSGAIAEREITSQELNKPTAVDCTSDEAVEKETLQIALSIQDPNNSAPAASAASAKVEDSIAAATLTISSAPEDSNKSTLLAPASFEEDPVTSIRNAMDVEDEGSDIQPAKSMDSSKALDEKLEATFAAALHSEGDISVPDASDSAAKSEEDGVVVSKEEEQVPP